VSGEVNEVPDVSVGLIFWGDNLIHESVSSRIGLEATRIWHAGDFVSGTLVKKKVDSWAFWLPVRKTCFLEPVVLELLDVIDGKEKGVLSVVGDFAVSGKISCRISGNLLLPELCFSLLTLKRVVDIGLSLDVNIVVRA